LVQFFCSSWHPFCFGHFHCLLDKHIAFFESFFPQRLMASGTFFILVSAVYFGYQWLQDVTALLKPPLSFPLRHHCSWLCCFYHAFAEFSVGVKR
jgi:hypothetical protein